MTIQDQLFEMTENCHQVIISTNDHKVNAETVQEFFNEFEEDLADIANSVFSKMIALNRMIRIQLYQYNSVGFFVVYHYDMALAIQRAHELYLENQ